jgi:hypothetical protein
VASYIRIDGEGVDLVGARMIWRKASSGGRAGFVFQITGHGGRHVLHLAGWAPGEAITDLSGQVITIQSPGPDCAADGRLFRLAVIRFGRVREQSLVASIDGTVEDLDPGSDARSELESDVRASVAQSQDPRWCLSCGTSLEPHLTDVDDFVGGVRVRMVATRVLCPDCADFAEAPKFCPICGEGYDPDEVRTLSADGAIGYTADCPSGHRYSGRLGG